MAIISFPNAVIHHSLITLNNIIKLLYYVIVNKYKDRIQIFKHTNKILNNLKHKNHIQIF